MKRIFMAFLIMVVGVAGSWYFLRPQEWTTNSGNKRVVVASVVELRNDVNRQEEGRLLWSPIRKGDQIFLGDKVKTGGLSGAMIQFTDSDSKLEIEENSMIVMSQGGKKLALNMLEGRVFLQEGESSGHQVDLLSNGQKIEVQGDTAVSVTKDGGSKVESFKGQGENVFVDLSPHYSQEILSAKNEIDVTWKGDSRNEMVSIALGESPLLLKKLETTSSFSSGKMKVNFRPGLNYWQLSVGEMKSPLMKLTLTRPLAPTPLSPADKEFIKLGERAFDLKWIKGNTTGPVTVEVARDPEFKNLVVKEAVTDQTFFTPPEILPEGDYHWRVRTELSPQESLVSKVHSFRVHRGNHLLSPALLSPEDNAVFYLFPNVPRPVKFEWKKQENVRGYDLKIAGENFNRETQLTDAKAQVNLNRVGVYTWEVLSQGSDGKASIYPVKRRFEVREAARILWAMNQKMFTYLENLPIVILRWEKRYKGVAKLFISSSPDMKDAEVYTVEGKDFPYRPMREGMYFAKITSFDDQMEESGESDIFEFTVKEAPLPEAPVLQGEKLLASSQGELRTKVLNSKPEWSILAELVDERGRVLDERRFSDENLRFTGLLPGKYYLHVKFQDEFKRAGKSAPRVEVAVPEKSTIAAPKIKGIKVR